MNEAIDAYHAGLPPEDRAICDRLAAAIEHGLPGAESKVWHAHPVWFLDGNPIVGYGKLKGAVRAGCASRPRSSGTTRTSSSGRDGWSG